jgi:hypothetical protein
MSLFQLFLTVCVAQVAGEILYLLWKARGDILEWHLSQQSRSQRRCRLDKSFE